MKLFLTFGFVASFERGWIYVPKRELRTNVVQRRSIPSSKGVLLDSPCYSFSTIDEDGNTNMNIVTYASPIGIRPERVWAVSLYRGTKSHDNFVQTKRGVLQLLSTEHAQIVGPLGGDSGWHINKAEVCASLGFTWQTWEGFAVLPNCRAYILLEEKERSYGGDDHDLSICLVKNTKQNVSIPQLGTQELRNLGIIDQAGRATMTKTNNIHVLCNSPRIELRKNVLSEQECEAIIHAAKQQQDWTISNAPVAQFDSRRLIFIFPLIFSVPLSRLYFDLTDRGLSLDDGLKDAIYSGTIAFLLVAIIAKLVQFIAQSQAPALRTSTVVQLSESTLQIMLAKKTAQLFDCLPYFLEAPVVSSYTKGRPFALHNDASANPNEWADQGGQRMATCILYLNNVARGGATYFDKLNIRVQPSQGDALLFFPAHSNTFLPDDRTTHASEPAIDQKWIVQLWRRQRQVPPPLGLPNQLIESGEK